ncbi:MAG: bifunctional 3,4-dihydroxy-2-butanone-4-phosphate synthase/GTP cyclohydrolase II [Pseudomonadota bacterium]
MALNSIPELLEDITAGKMVILMDDEDRENEGDLIMAAEMVTPEAINFMTKYARGLICLPLTREKCEQLQLPLMVQNNGAQYSTNFTVSIEAAEGVTTGISAADRAATVLAAVKDQAKPSDLVQPGHIFPLMAKPGGVLNRAGHTEAGCDLARLAGKMPAAVIVEILKDDGSMARRPDLEAFAKTHELKMGTIADLIEYRALNETTIQRLNTCHWPTPYGDFKLVSYQDTIDNEAHFALIKGEVDSLKPTLTRVHLADHLQDILACDRNPKQWSLHRSMQYISESDEPGVIVLLGHSATPADLLSRVSDFAKMDQGQEFPKSDESGSLRTIGIGSQILADLGVRKLRLLSPPKRYHALSGFKLEIVEYIE